MGKGKFTDIWEGRLKGEKKSLRVPQWPCLNDCCCSFCRLPSFIILIVSWMSNACLEQNDTISLPSGWFITVFTLALPFNCVNWIRYASTKAAASNAIICWINCDPIFVAAFKFPRCFLTVFCICWLAFASFAFNLLAYIAETLCSENPRGCKLFRTAWITVLQWSFGWIYATKIIFYS